MKRLFRAPAVQEALARLMALYLRFALRTIRWRQEGRGEAEAIWDAGGGVIVCFWHSRIALSPACWPLGRAQEPRALISLSPDGQFIARAVERLGFPAIRGSSSKKSDPKKAKGGASAFREVLRWILDGGGIAVTPDGPRGPVEEMAAGAPMLAKASGAPILLVGLAVEPCMRLKSWDRAVIPLPFGRGAITWGRLDPVAREASDFELARLRQEWSEALSALTRRAELIVA